MPDLFVCLFIFLFLKQSCNVVPAGIDDLVSTSLVLELLVCATIDHYTELSPKSFAVSIHFTLSEKQVSASLGPCSPMAHQVQRPPGD